MRIGLEGYGWAHAGGATSAAARAAAQIAIDRVITAPQA